MVSLKLRRVGGCEAGLATVSDFQLGWVTFRGLCRERSTCAAYCTWWIRYFVLHLKMGRHMSNARAAPSTTALLVMKPPILAPAPDVLLSPPAALCPVEAGVVVAPVLVCAAVPTNCVESEEPSEE